MSTRIKQSSMTLASLFPGVVQGGCDVPQERTAAGAKTSGVSGEGSGAQRGSELLQTFR